MGKSRRSVGRRAGAVLAFLIGPVPAVAIVLTLLGLGIGGWFATRALDPEPKYGAFERRARAAMARIDPLPNDLIVADRWEECGQGRDPMCDSIVLLIRARDPSARPVDRLFAHLTGSGWTMHRRAHGGASGAHGRATIAIEPLEQYLRREDPDLFLEAFLETNSPAGVLLVTVVP